MSKPSKPKYSTINWSAYNESLRQRGAFQLWIDKDMEWAGLPSGKRGRTPSFSDAAIQFCLVVTSLPWIESFKFQRNLVTEERPGVPAAVGLAGVASCLVPSHGHAALIPDASGPLGLRAALAHPSSLRAGCGRSCGSLHRITAFSPSRAARALRACVLAAVADRIDASFCAVGCGWKVVTSGGRRTKSLLPPPTDCYLRSAADVQGTARP